MACAVTDVGCQIGALVGPWVIAVIVFLVGLALVLGGAIGGKFKTVAVGVLIILALVFWYTGFGLVPAPNGLVFR